MSKVMLTILFCAAACGGQTGVILDVTALSASPRGPAGFVQVDVLTQGGKRVASAFTSAEGLAHFRVPAGKYTIAVRSNNVSQCQGGSTKWVTLCSGQRRIVLKDDVAVARVSVELSAVRRPAGAF